MTDKGARRGVFGLALVAACGGAPFTLAPLGEDGGGMDGGGSAWTGAADAGGAVGTGLDSGAADARILDADAATTIDRAIADTAPPPACVTQAPITETCPGIGQFTMPTTFCVQDCLGSAGCHNEILSAPAPCNTWCTFTCACLSEAGICGAGSDITSCQQSGVPSPLDLACGSL